MKINSFDVKKLAQNFLLVFSVLLSAVMMTERESVAQTATVNFNGTVTTSCTLGTVTNGTLALTSSGFGLSTAASGGSVGSVALTCNGGTSVNINSFVQRSGPQTIPTGTAIVKDPNGSQMVSGNLNTTGNVGTAVYPTGGGVFNNQNFTVEVSLDNSSNLIQSGTYSYAVTIQFVPK